MSGSTKRTWQILLKKVAHDKVQCMNKGLAQFSDAMNEMERRRPRREGMSCKAPATSNEPKLIAATAPTHLLL